MKKTQKTQSHPKIAKFKNTMQRSQKVKCNNFILTSFDCHFDLEYEYGISKDLDITISVCIGCFEKS